MRQGQSHASVYPRHNWLPLDQAVDAIITYGAIVVRDSRVKEGDSGAFLDLVEDYFAQPVEDLRADENFKRPPVLLVDFRGGGASSELDELVI